MANPVGQDRLSQTANKLNALLHNRSVREIQESTNPELTGFRGWEAQVLQRIVQILQQLDRRSITEVYRDGLVNVFRHPEFEDVERFRQVIGILERHSLLNSILARILNASGVQIIIGGEGQYEEINDVSLVLSPYGVRSKAKGVLGIIGPRRMPYGRAISSVRYVAHLMDDFVADVYGV